MDIFWMENYITKAKTRGLLTLFATHEHLLICSTKWKTSFIGRTSRQPTITSVCVTQFKMNVYSSSRSPFHKTLSRLRYANSVTMILLTAISCLVSTFMFQLNYMNLYLPISNKIGIISRVCKRELFYVVTLTDSFILLL